VNTGVDDGPVALARWLDELTNNKPATRMVSIRKYITTPHGINIDG